MLSLVAIQERPDLEQTRNVLIESNAEMRKEIQQIEDRILYRLSVSEGSAVDDMDLILTLEASKVKSEQIKVRRVDRPFKNPSNAASLPPVLLTTPLENHAETIRNGEKLGSSVSFKLSFLTVGSRWRGGRSVNGKR